MEFVRQALVDRQEKLWEYLEATFTRDELVKIVSILTLTPDEAKDAS